MTNHDAPICTQEAARAVGLDVAPAPDELASMAARIVEMWGDRWAEPDDEVASVADAGAQLARAVPLLLSKLTQATAERDAFADRVDTLTAVAKSNKRYVRELYADLQKAQRERDELKERVTELDRDLGETIDDRDRAQDAADKLAYAIAPIEVIGEHSSENDPWKNALERVTPLAEVKSLRSQLVDPTASGAQPHCKAECGGPGYTHCELPPGHEGQHEAAMGNMRRTTWGPVR